MGGGTDNLYDSGGNTLYILSALITKFFDWSR